MALPEGPERAPMPRAVMEEVVRVILPAEVEVDIPAEVAARDTPPVVVEGAVPSWETDSTTP
jgi:hypothetical protein